MIETCGLVPQKQRSGLVQQVAQGERPHHLSSGSQAGVSAKADMFGCTCAPPPGLVSSELLYVTSASLSQVTRQGTERAVIAAARSQRPALSCDVRTAVSTRDAVTLMLRLTNRGLTLLRFPVPGKAARSVKRKVPANHGSR
jgi:hypothetical protein